MPKKIIILIGPICAGKGQVADILQSEFHFDYLRFSALLESIMQERYGTVTRDNYRVIANELRATHGPAALAVLTVQQLEQKNFTNVVIDGARNPAEIEYLKAYFPQDTVVSIAVNAPQQLRYERLIARKRESENLSFTEFKAKDDLELYGSGETHTQSVQACINMADATIDNIGTFAELHQKLTVILDTYHLKN